MGRIAVQVSGLAEVSGGGNCRNFRLSKIFDKDLSMMLHDKSTSSN